MDLDGFDAWCARAGTGPGRLFRGSGTGPDSHRADAPLLPPLERLGPRDLADLADRALKDWAFCVRPLWLDAPAETGALARVRYHALVSAWVARRGAGLRARMLARLVELAGLPRRLRADGFAVVRSVSPRERVGVAGVETSRGLLVHAVRMGGDGRIGDYRIIAPTEWNCHPSGPLAAALAGLDGSGEDLPGAARRLVESLDPCVGFDVEIRDA
jgi:Ni,Fe-hydrogenase I large subunit